MLSIAQNKAIYDFLTKEFLISATTFIVNCIYENQFIPLRQNLSIEQEEDNIGYPLISIDYNESNVEVDNIGTGGIWKSIILEVNFYAKDFDDRPTGEFINGQIIANEMSRLSMVSINSDFNTDRTLLAQNVKLQRRATKDRDLSQIAGELHVYRLMVEVPVIYKVET